MINNKVRKDQRSLLYLAICSKLHAPGIIKKIKGVVCGTESCGYESKSVIIEPSSVIQYLVFVYKMAFAEEKYVLIRYVNRVGLLIFFAGIILKCRGKKLFIDVPTPMRNHLRESIGNRKIKWEDLLEVSLIIIQGCVPFLSATKIIQYAEEGLWFSFGVRKKTIKIGNGVSVETIPCRQSAPVWPSKNLYLVAVGTIAFWHGWDRMIDAIRILRDDPCVDFDVRLTIIGDGPDRENLERLALSYDLSDNICFLGFLYGQDLYAEYKKAHFGIGSLGWSRIGIQEASPIKVREYLAAGLPVIKATKDPDFHGDEKILLDVSDDENNYSIVSLLKSLPLMEIPSPQECRMYAEKNLDFKIKMHEILSMIDNNKDV